MPSKNEQKMLMVFSDSYKKELFSRILSDIAKIYNSTPSRIIEKFLEKELLAEDKNLSEIAEKLYADEKAKCKTALRILINRAARDPSNISKECFVEMIDTTKIGFDYNGDYIDNGTAEEKEALSYELNNLLAFSKELKNIKRLPFEMRHSFLESLNYLEDNIIHDSDYRWYCGRRQSKHYQANKSNVYYFPLIIIYPCSRPFIV